MRRALTGPAPTLAIAVALLTGVPPAGANGYYRCTVQGRLVLSDVPCDLAPAGSVQPPAPPSGVAAGGAVTPSTPTGRPAAPRAGAATVAVPAPTANVSTTRPGAPPRTAGNASGAGAIGATASAERPLPRPGPTYDTVPSTPVDRADEAPPGRGSIVRIIDIPPGGIVRGPRE